MNHLIGIGLIFLLLTVNTPVLAGLDGAHLGSLSDNVLFVGGSGPGNYSSIQEAINASSNGDTVFVFDDSAPYYEHLKINTTISLLGEKKETTIIDGSYTSDVILILAGGVQISGFTIQHCGNITTDSGIRSDSYLEHLQINENIFRENHEGIYLHCGRNFTVLSNVLINNDCGIDFFECRWWNVSGNRIENSQDGVQGVNMRDGTFSWNTIRGNTRGLTFDGTDMLIHHNLFEENDVFAIEQVFACYNTIQYNEFRNNSIGIELIDSWASIKFNNFIGNQKNLNITENLYICLLPFPHSVFWRNYWDDHRVPLPKKYPIDFYWLSLIDGDYHFMQGIRFDLFPAIFPHRIDMTFFDRT